MSVGEDISPSLRVNSELTQRLKATLADRRREEALWAARYSQRRCASEDVTRAKTLRILAEVDCFRHTKRQRAELNEI
ncbi:hypothetical protein LOC70_22250 [Rhodopirellula sp. JC737]|nr:hypothetical protein [Rhodopirellula sp. JC737]